MNHDFTQQQNSIFEASSSYLPPMLLLSFPYRSRIDLVSEYGNNTGLIRGRYGNDRKNIGKARKIQKTMISKF